jgi:hypothetical protein
MTLVTIDLDSSRPSYNEKFCILAETCRITLSLLPGLDLSLTAMLIESTHFTKIKLTVSPTYPGTYVHEPFDVAVNYHTNPVDFKDAAEGATAQVLDYLEDNLIDRGGEAEAALQRAIYRYEEVL